MKKIVLFIGILLSGLLMIACNKKPKVESFDGVEGAREITFWHAWGKENQDMLEKVIAEFTKKTGIKVTQEGKGGYNELESLVKTSMPAGNQPDVVMVYPDHVAGYNSRKERIKDLMPIIRGKDGYTQDELNDFYEGFLNEGKAFGKKDSLFVLPLAKSTEVMFYNKDLFDKYKLEVPKTFDDVKSVSEQIYKKIQADTNILPGDKEKYIPFAYDSEGNLMITTFEQKELPYTSIVKGKGQIDFSEPGINEGVIKHIIELKEMYDNKYLLTGKDSQAGYHNAEFTSQKLFMIVGSSAGIKYNVPKDGETPFNIGIAKLPQYNTSSPKYIQQGPSIAMFDNGPSKNKSAWEFIKFLVSTDINAKVASQANYMPVRKSSYNTKYFQEEVLSLEDGTNQIYSLRAKVYKIQNEISDYGFTSPVFDRSSIARQEIGNAIRNVFTLTKEKYGSTYEKQKEAIQKILDDALIKIES